MSILKGLFKDKKLEIELNELNEKYDFLKEAFVKLTNHKENLEIELKSYELLKIKFQKKDEEFKSLKLYFEKQQEEIINYKILKRDCEKEIEKLKKKQEELKIQNAEKELLEAKNKEQKLIIEKLEEKFIEEEAEKNRLLKEFSKSLSAEKNLKEELSKLKIERDNLRTNKESERLKRLNLESDLGSLKKEREDLKIQNSEKKLLEVKNKEQKLIIEKLEEKFEKEEAEKNILLKEISKSLSAEKNLKEELSKLKIELDDLKTKKESERLKRLNLESDLENLKREKSKLEDDLEEKRKVKVLYDQLILKLDELKKENKELKLKIDEQKQPKEEEKRIDESLRIKMTNPKSEEKFDCLSYEDYVINKENLNNYLLRFSEEHFRKILSLSREKNIFNVLEERQLLNIITWLKFNTPLEKLNIEKLKELYIKFMEKYHGKEVIKSPALKIVEKLEEEKKILPEVKVENKNSVSLVGGWISYENYISNKNDLVPLLKTFNENDFKEIFIEGKKRKIIKPSQERDFSNILTRLKLKLPVTDMSLEKIEPFYENLMNNIHKNKIQNTKRAQNLEIEKDVDKDEEEFFEIEKYSMKDWHRLYELSKDDKNISEWLRKYIFTLSKYVQNNLEITQNQYKVIKNNYALLYPLMRKIKKDYEEDKKLIKNEINNKELDNTKLKIDLDKNIADILF